MQIITKAQADFIETFGDKKEKAIHFISLWGWGHYLVDGKGHEYEDKDVKPFSIDDKLEIINAIINGYEVKEPEKWVITADVNVKNERVAVYYQGYIYIPTDKLKEAVVYKTKQEAEDEILRLKLGKNFVPELLND